MHEFAEMNAKYKRYKHYVLATYLIDTALWKAVIENNPTIIANMVHFQLNSIEGNKFTQMKMLCFLSII